MTFFARAAGHAAINSDGTRVVQNGIETIVEAAASRKAILRIVPLAIVGLFLSFIDRTNIAVAGSDMSSALGLSPTTFGLASGLFFISYIILGIPSNLALQRFGARFWLALILILWGVVCMGTALVKGAGSLYVMRLLLGIGEAGFFPGVLFYLSQFIPAQKLPRAYSFFQLGIPLSLSLGSAMTSGLLTLNGTIELSGWQWVFIIEGGSAVLLGLVWFAVMARSPTTAAWLSPQEKEVLTAAIERDRSRNGNGDQNNSMTAILVLKNSQLWYYTAVFFFMQLGFLSVTYWLPQIIKLRFAANSVEFRLPVRHPMEYRFVVAAREFLVLRQIWTS